MNSNLVGISVNASTELDLRLTERLADRLALPLLTAGESISVPALRFRDGRLELSAPASVGTLQPLCIDFLSGPSFYRFVHDRRINQLLGRAVGIKPGRRPAVCDATAGFGEDGLVLASLGCRVVMVERSPAIWALLDDALRRATDHPRLGLIVRQNIELHLGDARDFLPATRQRFDTIYLDPMYPVAKKSALNKVKMRLLRTLVGDDPDSDGLLEAARHHDPSRITVKRPLPAPPLTADRPQVHMNGKSCRFDIYLPPYL